MVVSRTSAVLVGTAGLLGTLGTLGTALWWRHRQATRQVLGRWAVVTMLAADPAPASRQQGWRRTAPGSATSTTRSSSCGSRPTGRKPSGRRSRPAGKGGSIFALGVFGAVVNKFPLGAVINKGLTVSAVQQHGQGYIPMLLQRMATGELVTEHLATQMMPYGRARRATPFSRRRPMAASAGGVQALSPTPLPCWRLLHQGPRSSGDQPAAPTTTANAPGGTPQRRPHLPRPPTHRRPLRHDQDQDQLPDPAARSGLTSDIGTHPRPTRAKGAWSAWTEGLGSTACPPGRPGAAGVSSRTPATGVGDAGQSRRTSRRLGRRSRPCPDDLRSICVPQRSPKGRTKLRREPCTRLHIALR